MTTAPNKDTTMTTPTPAGIELPTLPSFDGFTERQMRGGLLTTGAYFTATLQNFARAAVIADRARTAASCAGWLPIETAPAGTTDSILICTEGFPGSTEEVFWHDGSECYGHRGEAGWFSESDRGNLLTASNAHGTHWMPLPAAPGAPATVRAERTEAATAEPAPVVQPVAATEVTDAMVKAYLDANDQYWRETDALPRSPTRWRTGTAIEATRVSLEAALQVARPIPEGCTPADARKLREANHALAVEVHQLREALSEYANPLNWSTDESGIRRMWLEPGSNTPDAYNGFELARAVPAPTAGEAGGADQQGAKP